MSDQRNNHTPDKAAADTLGLDGVYVDPLWRIHVQLSPLEQDLLGSWWVRRLAFVAHAGAAAMTSTQSYSRLEHSLGVLALVVHFAPEDTAARAAALLHDVGHLPLSHTLEGLTGLNHHILGRRRIGTLDPILTAHGLSATQIIAVDDGHTPSPLHGIPGHLTLDHLDSFLRSGQAHGRTQTTPAAMLPALRLLNGGVDTNADTACELTSLIVAEARSQRSPANVTANAVIRSMAATLLERTDPAKLAAMTDDELWAALLDDPSVGSTLRRFRAAPQKWSVDALHRDDSQLAPKNETGPPGDAAIEYEIARSYLDLPTVDGSRLATPGELGELARSLPLHFRVRGNI